MRTRLTYPGTNIPLIRGGAPDARAGDKGPAASPAPASGAASPAAGAAASASAAPAAGSEPAGGGRNWEKDYTELQGRYSRYEKLGAPEALEGVVGRERTYEAQLRAINKDFQDGKLTYAQAKAAAADAGPESDPFDDTYETLAPRDQAQRMIGVMRKEFGDLTKKQLAEIEQRSTAASGNLSTQMKIAWKLMQAKLANKDLDLDTLITKSTETSGYGPEQIIDMMIEAQGAPGKQDAAIKAALAKQEATLRAEFENKRTAQPSRAAPRIMPKTKPGTPAERQDKIYNGFMDRLAAAAGKRE